MTKAWQIWLVLALIFAAGGVSGGLVAYHVAERNAHRGLRPPEVWGPRFYEAVARDLNLTPAQRQRIRPIVHENIESLVKLRQQSMRTARDTVVQMEKEIAAELTPEQRKRYQELLERRREAFRERMEHKGFTPHGRPHGEKPPPAPAGQAGAGAPGH